MIWLSTPMYSPKLARVHYVPKDDHQSLRAPNRPVAQRNEEGASGLRLVANDDRPPHVTGSLLSRS